KIQTVLKKNRKIVTGFHERNGSFEVKMEFKDVAILNKALVRAGVNVAALVPRRSLEDFFLSITENESRI
ncbi:MAG: Bacitracin ABC transporter ATP-binding protein, partial [Bacteroidetes bacterium]|nr:Bacitracin ABC transporter ATP-binding protein [Bacteroidota bacterium]